MNKKEREELVERLEKRFKEDGFKFREKEAIVIENKIKNNERPEGYFTYPIRTGGWDENPVTIERSVVVNYYATLVTKESLDDYLVEGYSNLSEIESRNIQENCGSL